jgi:hypothetical protein
MSPLGFEPGTSASELPQTHALDRYQAHLIIINSPEHKLTAICFGLLPFCFSQTKHFASLLAVSVTNHNIWIRMYVRTTLRYEACLVYVVW